MGRPLNKRFFGDGAGLIACAVYTERAGASTAGYIVSQRSNTQYEVADETLTDVDVDNLVIGSRYEIAVAGTTDWVAAGSANNTAGTIFTAATAASDGTGTAREIVFARVQAAAVTAAGQMRVDVQAENATAVVNATVAITGTGGTGTLLTAVVVTGGYGYWTNQTGVALLGGPDGTIDYQVANGSIVAVQPAGVGAGNIDGTYDVATTFQLANPPLQYARIINARQVKSFEGNTFDWPIVGVDDGAGPTGMTQADLGTQ